MNILTQILNDAISNFNETGKPINFLEFSREILTASYNELMSIQADMVCEELDVVRNGYRTIEFSTPVGTLELEVPKFRNGSYHPDIITQRYDRCDQCLITAAHELYVSGMSIRKLERYFEGLGIKNLKHSTISNLMQKLDKDVEAFNDSNLGRCERPYLFLDATYMTCKDEGSQAIVTAITINDNGKKEFIGEQVVDIESYESWIYFLQSLKARGLRGVKLCVSDAHPGLKRAIKETFIGAKWQRCIVHLERNVLNRCRNQKQRKAVGKILKVIFAEQNQQMQRALYQLAIERIESISSDAANVLVEAESDALTYLEFPKSHWRKIRTNNVQERANREIKRRSKVVQIFPNVASMQRLVGAVVITLNAVWGQRHYMSQDVISELYSDRAKSESFISADAFMSAKAKLKLVHQELIDDGLIAA